MTRSKEALAKLIEVVEDFPFSQGTLEQIQDLLAGKMDAPSYKSPSAYMLANDIATNLMNASVEAYDNGRAELGEKLDALKWVFGETSSYLENNGPVPVTLSEIAKDMAYILDTQKMERGTASWLTMALAVTAEYLEIHGSSLDKASLQPETDMQLESPRAFGGSQPSSYEPGQFALMPKGDYTALIKNIDLKGGRQKDNFDLDI